MKKSLKVWKETPKSMWKLEFNENKQIKYTKKLIKEFLLENVQR